MSFFLIKRLYILCGYNYSKYWFVCYFSALMGEGSRNSCNTLEESPLHLLLLGKYLKETSSQLLGVNVESQEFYPFLDDSALRISMGTGGMS